MDTRGLSEIPAALLRLLLSTHGLMYLCALIVSHSQSIRKIRKLAKNTIKKPWVVCVIRFLLMVLRVIGQA